MSHFFSHPTFKDMEIPNSNTELIGKGTFGIVKLAKSIKSNKHYALKIVDMKNLEKSLLFNIEREIQIHKRLNHPNIIKFYEHHQTEQKSIIMILEYASNGNLFSYIRKKKKLSEMEAFVFFYQTSLALEYLHKNDIIHRDLKPENLLLDEKNKIKLCDFGWSTQGVNIKRNTFCGTYEYMSPEVVFKRSYNENIDVWALGILFYEMIQGESPYKAKNLKEIRNKILFYNKLSFSDNVSNDLKNLISSILKINPLERLSLQGILGHPWVKRMYEFVNYKDRFEENEEKISTRGASFSNNSDNNETKKLSFFESKTMEIDFENSSLKNMGECKKNNRIFENKLVEQNGAANVLKEMEILMKGLEIATHRKKI